MGLQDLLDVYLYLLTGNAEENFINIKITVEAATAASL
jgi:hypothetical protein